MGDLPCCFISVTDWEWIFTSPLTGEEPVARGQRWGLVSSSWVSGTVALVEHEAGELS